METFSDISFLNAHPPVLFLAGTGMRCLDEALVWLCFLDSVERFGVSRAASLSPSLEENVQDSGASFRYRKTKIALFWTQFSVSSSL